MCVLPAPAGSVRSPAGARSTIPESSIPFSCSKRYDSTHGRFDQPLVDTPDGFELAGQRTRLREKSKRKTSDGMTSIWSWSARDVIPITDGRWRIFAGASPSRRAGRSDMPNSDSGERRSTLARAYALVTGQLHHELPGRHADGSRRADNRVRYLHHYS